MSANAEQRRFNWIHLYCDALLWALINETTMGRHGQVVLFQDLANGLVQRWLGAVQADAELSRWLAAKRGRGCYWSSLLVHDLYYLYDLEAELWGADTAAFLNRFQGDNPTTLEPFRFVLLFYLVERALKLLLAHLGYLPYEQANLSHARIREAAYTHLFTGETLGRWFPYPFNLTALTQRLDRGETDHQRHCEYSFVGSHFSIAGKEHYAEILKSALCQAATWQRERRLQRGARPERGSIRAFFFDALWHYSESYRYRVPLANPSLRQNPFAWGLNLRWLGSAFLNIIELWFYTLSARYARTVWDTYSGQSRSPVLLEVQQPRWNTIRLAGPQMLI